MNLYADIILVDENLYVLASKDDDAKPRAASNLKLHVELAARELSLERFSRFETELYMKIISLVNSTALHEKTGGILAIRELIDCTSAAAENKIMKFSSALSNALHGCNDFDIIQLIADAYGHMAQNSPVAHVDYLETELIRTLEWLRTGKNASSKRYAACAVLEQLATHAPTIFFAKINDFFDLIWHPLWDSKESIRLVAGRALSACLAVLKERTYHLQWYCFIYDQLQDGFNHGTEESVHGSLLVVNELLKYTGDFMIPRFKEICKSLMNFKDHKSRLVRSAIISLLPLLAKLCPDAFARSHMEESIDFLIKSFKASELRPLALLSIGKLCLTIGPYLINRIDELINIVKEAIGSSMVTTSNKRTSTKNLIECTSEALSCISDMVQGLGSPFHQRLLALLEPMFQSGFTSTLLQTLSVICEFIPQQKAPIQQRLLEEAVKVLGGDSRPMSVEPPFVYSWAKRGERLPKSLANAMNTTFGAMNMENSMEMMLNRPSSQAFGQMYRSSSLTNLNNLTAGTRGSLQLGTGGIVPPPVTTPSATVTKSKPKLTFSFFNTSSSTTSNTPSSTNALAKTTGTNNSIGLAAIGQGLGLSYESDFTSPASPNTTNNNMNNNNQPLTSNEIVLLALQTLSSLSIPSYQIMNIILNSVLPYCQSDDYLVRKEACITCASMTSQLMNLIQSLKGPTAMAIEEIVTRLIEIAISDPSPTVRLGILTTFPQEFDVYLARTHHIDHLFYLFSDDTFEIKLTTLKLFDRLVFINPAAILPYIRIFIQRILSEISAINSDYRSLEECISMLGNIMKCSKFHFLIKPIMLTLLQSLPLKCDDSRTMSCVLECIGELSMVLPKELIVYSDVLLPIIISNIFDSTILHKQEIAVVTLGRFAKSTGLVVKPYIQYPQLLPRLLDILCANSQQQQSPSLRIEILRLIGLLGALEPSRYSSIVSCLSMINKDIKQTQNQEYLAFTLQDLKSKSPSNNNSNHNNNNNLLNGLNNNNNTSHDHVHNNPLTFYVKEWNLIDFKSQITLLPLMIQLSMNPLNNMTTNNKSNMMNVSVNSNETEVLNPSETALTTVNNPPTAANAHTNNNKSSTFLLSSSDRRKNNNGVESEELIRTDYLLNGDNLTAASSYFMYEQSVMRALPEPPQDKMINAKHSPNGEEFYPRVALTALLKILQDQSLSIHHSTATQTIIEIFHSLGMRCIPFLEQIVPYFLQMVRKSSVGLRQSILQQLSQLIAIIGNHIAPYLPSILEILRDYWSEHLEYVLAIVQQIAITSTDTFAQYLPTLLPYFLSSLTLSRDIVSTIGAYSSPHSINNNTLNNNGLSSVSSTSTKGNTTTTTTLSKQMTSSSGSGNPNSNASNPTNVATTSGTSSSASSSTNMLLHHNIPEIKLLEEMLACLKNLKLSLRPYLYLFVPKLCKLWKQLQEFQHIEILSLQILIIQTIRSLILYSKGYLIEQNNEIISILMHTICKSMLKILPMGLNILQTANIPSVSSSSASNSSGNLANNALGGNNSMAISILQHHSQYSLLLLLRDLQQENILCLINIAQQIGYRILPFDSLIVRILDNVLSSHPINQSTFVVDITTYKELIVKIRCGQHSELDYQEYSSEYNQLMDSYSFLSNMPMKESDLVGMRGGNNGPILGLTTPGGGRTNSMEARQVRPPSVASPSNDPSTGRSTPNLPNNQAGGYQGLSRWVLNQHQLAKAWDVSQRSTANDWHEWMLRLNIELLRESPSPVLRACAPLAQAHPAMAKDLFHAGFVSCWIDLSEQYQDHLIRALQKAFCSNTIPPEILQTLLNLAEFMEHDVEALPISLSILAEHAQKGHAYAKALHYRELEFQTDPAGCFEKLININKKLDQYEAASGLLNVAKQIQKKFPELKEFYTVQESWLAKLGYWDEALIKYDEKLANNPREYLAIAGKLKCLEALGRWEEAVKLCEEHLDNMRVDCNNQVYLLNKTHTKAAVIGARAAWSLNEWSLMNNFVQQLPPDNIDGCFMKAVLAIHAKNFEEAQLFLEKTRKALDKSITSLMSESYGRAYVPLIMVQQCSELEEIMEYMKFVQDAGLINTSNNHQLTMELVPTLASLSMNPLSSSSTQNNLNNKNNNNNTFAKAIQDNNSPSYAGNSSSSAMCNQLTPGILTNMLQQHYGQQKPNMKITIAKQLMISDFGPDLTLSTINAGSNEMNQLNQQALVEEAQRRKGMLSDKWRQRIRGCYSYGRAAIPFWKYLLNGRRMILSEKEDIDTWLDFVSLCRNGGNSALAERVLMISQRSTTSPIVSKHNLFSIAEMESTGSTPSSPVPNGFPTPSSLTNNNLSEEDILMERRIRYAMLKQKWSTGDRTQALQGLEQIVKTASKQHGSLFPSTSLGSSAPSASSAVSSVDTSYLHALLKLGDWKIAILDPGQPVDMATRMEVLTIFSKATLIDPNSYRASHQWGLCNYRAIEEIRGTNKLLSPHTQPPMTGNSPVVVERNNIPPLPTHRPSFRASSSTATINLTLGQPNKQTLPFPGMPSNPSTSSASVSSTSSTSSATTSSNSSTSSASSKDQVIAFAVNAIKGLMRALCLGTRKYSSSVMQDMLCILSLWFRLGKIPEVNSAIEAGLATVPIDNWLGVLPQLIARIDHKDKEPRNLLHQLIMRLGSKHAQALVYPLSVALKYPKGPRKEAAETLMNGLRQHSTKLIDQALMVSQELVRVAISWEECFHWGLEEASRHCFGEGNIQGMLDVLLPLHQMIEAGATTLREISFLEAYRFELSNAHEYLQSYLKAMKEKHQLIPTSKASGGPYPEDSFIAQAWDCYYPIFKRINSQLPHINALDLQSCSPALHSAKHLDLGVPGTYSVNGNAVKIRSFHQVISIIRSKQRPRKLRMTGEDGQDYVFLLKGHEDLRQDERAMQLFGLVNALLYHDRRMGVNSEDFQIQRYAVIPLSHSVGLIGWVPNCDTLHDLIRGYRDSRKIMIDVEHRLILQIAPGKLYDMLPAMHKLEVFEYAMAYTAGEDLAKILWLKSENSESWLQRRATYTRSLAVMSMVGYILGLGDRHPSNLMIDRKTGKILHIDFGDCFEITKHREKFPEKVPFRLTRMLVNAMEVAGIEGNYRTTCEKVMSVLRENRDSLVATLEAFVHDPLFSFRLMNIHPKKGKETSSTSSTAKETSSATKETSTTKETNKDKQPSTPTTPNKSIDTNNNNNNNNVKEIIDEEVPSSTQSNVQSNVDPSRQKMLISSQLTDSLHQPSPIKSVKPSATAHAYENSQLQATTTTIEDIIPNPVTPYTAHDAISSSYIRMSTIARGGAQPQATTTNNPVNQMINSNNMNNNAPFSGQSGLLPGQVHHSNQSAFVSTQQASEKSIASNASNKDMLASANTSTKSVSFSVVNQTIDADNTIRRSSMLVVSTNEKKVVEESNETSANNNTNNNSNNNNASSNNNANNNNANPPSLLLVDNSSANQTSTSNNNNANNNNTNNTTLLPPHPPSLKTPQTTNNNNNNNNNNQTNTTNTTTPPTTTPSIILGKSLLNSNLHLEMASLANSINQQGANNLNPRAVSSSARFNSVRSLIDPSTVTQLLDTSDESQQELTEKAVLVIRRIMDKLTGLDFNEGQQHQLPGNNSNNSNNNTPSLTQAHPHALTVAEQVDRLIREATSNENLSQSYFGWCPFW